jgi:hypothetical protein
MPKDYQTEDLKDIKLIEWRDSSMQITQEPQDSKWEVECLASVGFVLVEDNDKIVLAGDLLEGDCRRVIVIPKENITRNKTLFL